MEEVSFWRYAQCQVDNFLKNVFYNYYLYQDRNASHQLVNVSLTGLRNQCVLKVCRQSTIFNDLSIIVFILKIGSVLGRILPYFSSSQSNCTLLYSLLASRIQAASLPELRCLIVQQSEVWVSLKVTNSTTGECLSVTQKFSCWIRETRFEPLVASSCGGFSLLCWSTDLTNSENFPLDSSPAPTSSLPPKLY